MGRGTDWDVTGELMDGEEEDIVGRLKKEIERLKREKPEVGEIIGSIVVLNSAEGRVKKFLDNGTTQTVEEYVQRVEQYYELSNEFLEDLEEGAIEIWEPFLQKLGKWAYNFLAKKGVPEDVGRFQIAEDCANEAGARLANTRFPYDVHYDSWACIFVHNVCLNYIRKHAEKHTYIDVDLAETAEWLEQFSSPSDTKLADKRLDLLNAIDQLNSEDRKTFILLYYFEGKDFDEIAVILGRTKNALYKLHFDALDNLRKIF